MKMKRYDFKQSKRCAGQYDMQISEHEGEWVRYEDARREIDELKHDLSRANHNADLNDPAPQVPTMATSRAYGQNVGADRPSGLCDERLAGGSNPADAGAKGE